MRLPQIQRHSAFAGIKGSIDRSSESTVTSSAITVRSWLYTCNVSRLVSNASLKCKHIPLGDVLAESPTVMVQLIRAPQSPFDPPTLLYELSTTPLNLLIRSLHHLLASLRSPAHPLPIPSDRIRLVCISDTHNEKLPVPDGDVLIHAGDLTVTGTADEIQAQINWLASLPHAHKIAIAGNHDSYIDPRSRYATDADKKLDWKGIRYLQHSSVVLSFPERGERSLSFYGAPQIPECGSEEFAFQYGRGEDAWRGTVPRDTDVLVTHTPPRWHLDLPIGMGCGYLLEEVWRVRPIVHVFGHVHAGRGREDVFWDGEQESYERLRGRGPGGLSWWGFLSPGVWSETVRMVVLGIAGLLWTKVWGAEAEGTTMVNAALIDWTVGKIGYEAQIVDI